MLKLGVLCDIVSSMLYIILIIIGTVGALTTLWLSHPKIALRETPAGDPWYILHPENFESGVIQHIRKTARAILKLVLIWMIAAYRKLSEKITVKQVLKKKIRGFLYEHSHDSARQPSEFWNKVRHPVKTRKHHIKPTPSPSEEKVEMNDSI